jgi:hypothetical protein
MVVYLSLHYNFHGMEDPEARPGYLVETTILFLKENSAE